MEAQYRKCRCETNGYVLEGLVVAEWTGSEKAKTIEPIREFVSYYLSSCKLE